MPFFTHARNRLDHSKKIQQWREYELLREAQVSPPDVRIYLELEYQFLMVTSGLLLSNLFFNP